jgi:plastocyanin
MKIVLLALLVSLALLFGCAAYPSSGSTGTPASAPSAATPPSATTPQAPTANNASAASPQAPAGAPATVQISNFAFNPASLTVAKGAKVTWTNQDNAPHTITSTSGAFDSKTLQNGASWTFTFERAGTYDYGCSIHTSMKGRIIVTG